MGDTQHVVDFDPLLDRVLPAGARAVGDRRHVGQAPETVAVIDERFRPEGDRQAADGFVTRAK